VDKYIEAPEVEKIARELIPRHHSHLVEANIKYEFRTDAWLSKGRFVLGKTEKASDKLRFRTGYDFFIVVNWQAWDQMTTKERLALVDHELCHCGRGLDDDFGNPSWTLEDHDFTEFASVVSRHGMWNTDLRRLQHAQQQYEQLTLDMREAG